VVTVVTARTTSNVVYDREAARMQTCDEFAEAVCRSSTHRGKWGQLTPWKMCEKLKIDDMQTRAVFYVYVIF